jgi:adenine-specific DNA-methyltransferase
VQSAVEQARLRVSRQTDARKKAQLGQFFTPERTASFMAGLFPAAAGECRLLDPGAGIGSLSAAFLERWRTGGFAFRSVELDAFEIDPSLHGELSRTLARFTGDACSVRLSSVDFIGAAAARLGAGQGPAYSHAILNPPYKKIHGSSGHRLALRRAGIETVNLYSAFVALSVALLEPGGHLVAIIPRSFCNGPYYRPFRDYLLQRTALRHVHLFASRTHAFRDDAVLQENVIVHLERGAPQGDVRISTSTDDGFSDLVTREHAFERIVFPDDPEHFIHVPADDERSASELSSVVCHGLDALGIQVSTGPVVDFRIRPHLRDAPGSGTVPLLYPCHFSGAGVRWPLADIRKPNAVERNADTEKWLYPNGFYCVVRRFSSKEEPRRVVASVVEPGRFERAPMLGFENHLNLFHERRHGLPEELARGLAVFLSTTAVDRSFRRFNGHTQVNATDLRAMRYPSREALCELGSWAKRRSGELTQQEIDDRLGALL